MAWQSDADHFPSNASCLLANCSPIPSLTPCSFPGLEKKAKARPAGTLFRLLTVADPVLDPVSKQ